MDALKSLDGATFQPSERAMLNMLKGVLEYPVTVEARGAKVADDVLHFYLDNAPNEEEIGGVLLALWGVWLEVVSDIPHGHEWHQCLALAVDTIRQDKRAAGKGLMVCFDPMTYAQRCVLLTACPQIPPDLPELSIRLTEKWEDSKYRLWPSALLFLLTPLKNRSRVKKTTLSGSLPGKTSIPSCLSSSAVASNKRFTCPSGRFVRLSKNPLRKDL